MRGQVSVAVRARSGERHQDESSQPPGTDEPKPLPEPWPFSSMGLSAAVCVGAGLGARALGGQRAAHRTGVPALVGLALGLAAAAA